MSNRKPPQRRRPTSKADERREFINWLKSLQTPNRIRIKNATPDIVYMPTMLDQTAALHLAVYDGIIPNTDIMHLHILFQDLSRNPRKGEPDTWTIPTS
jgi:hypothetical protein